MKNLLVTVTFEEKETSVLLEKAMSIAEKFGSKRKLVVPCRAMAIRLSELKKEHKLVKRYADELREKKFDAEGLLVQGATVDMILRESVKLNIDLVIIGHHKHNLLYKIFVQDIDETIVHESKVPVLMIPFG